MTPDLEKRCREVAEKLRGQGAALRHGGLIDNLTMAQWLESKADRLSPPERKMRLWVGGKPDDRIAPSTQWGTEPPNKHPAWQEYVPASEAETIRNVATIELERLRGAIRRVGTSLRSTNFTGPMVGRGTALGPTRVLPQELWDAIDILAAALKGKDDAEGR